MDHQYQPLIQYPNNKAYSVRRCRLGWLVALAVCGMATATSHAGGFEDVLRQTQKQLEDAVRKGGGRFQGQTAPLPPHGDQRPGSPPRTAQQIHKDRFEQAQAEAERKRREVESETYTEAELREIGSRSFAGPSRNKGLEIDRVYSFREAWNVPLQSYNYFPLFRIVATRPQPYKGFYRVVCNYDPGKVPGSLYFWYRHRPVSEITATNDWYDGHLGVYDIAVTACPATVGDGLKMVYGEDILDRALAFGEETQRVATMSDAERKAYHDQQQRQRDAERYGMYSDWDKGATPNSQAADAALAARVNRAIAGLESEGRSLTAGTLRQVLDASLRADLQDLARSARARLDGIAVGAAQRKAFDNWDNQVGGHVLKAFRRLWALQTLNLTSSNEIDLRQLNDNEHARSVRQAAWRETKDLDFAVPMFKYFDGVFNRYLAGQPLLDRPYVAEMKKKLNATKLVSNKWRASVDTPTKESKQDAQMELMTLDELAAAEFGAALGKGFGAAISGYAMAKQANAEFNERISSTRRAFWSCYRDRCGDGAQRYFAYSKALRDKDIYYMIVPEVTRRLGGMELEKHAEVIMGATGSLNIDGGPVHSNCSAKWEDAKVSLSQHLGNWRLDLSNTEASRKQLWDRVARFTLSDKYGAWLQCRDRQEYFDRVRAGE